MNSACQAFFPHAPLVILNEEDRGGNAPKGSSSIHSAARVKSRRSDPDQYLHILGPQAVYEDGHERVQHLQHMLTRRLDLGRL